MILSMILVLVAVCAVPAYANEAQPVDPVAELQDAALNYEAAAEAQLATANNILQSRQAEAEGDEQEANRRRRNRNASLELQAVGQLLGAAGNLDHATRAWRAAAQATREEAAQQYFQRAAQDANRRATTLIRRAAELAEHAALEYAALQDLGKQVNASHRAGRIREQLSGRR